MCISPCIPHMYIHTVCMASFATTIIVYCTYVYKRGLSVCINNRYRNSLPSKKSHKSRTYLLPCLLLFVKYIIRRKQKCLLEIHNIGRMHFYRDILRGNHKDKNKKNSIIVLRNVIHPRHMIYFGISLLIQLCVCY